MSESKGSADPGSDKELDRRVYGAKLAEQAERFEEMVADMKAVCETKKQPLDQEERNLLSVAYKNVVGARRESWSRVYTLESKEKTLMESLNDQGKKAEAARHETQAQYCNQYRRKIETELTKICKEVIQLLIKHLIPVESAEIAAMIPTLITGMESHQDIGTESLEQRITSFIEAEEAKNHQISAIANGESLVFYFKMVGDYHRYLAEFNVEDEQERVQASTRSLASYWVATQIAKVHLGSGDPVRLGLALNFSVFYYEIMSQPDRACQLAKNAFDEAIAELDRQDTEQEQDSTLIMQLLRDNLALWTSDMHDAPQ